MSALPPPLTYTDANGRRSVGARDERIRKPRPVWRRFLRTCAAGDTNRRGPLVGATAAALVIAEVLRRLNGGPALEVLDMTLRDPRGRAAVEASVVARRFNPGFAS